MQRPTTSFLDWTRKFAIEVACLDELTAQVATGFICPRCGCRRWSGCPGPGTPRTSAPGFARRILLYAQHPPVRSRTASPVSEDCAVALQLLCVLSPTVSLSPIRPMPGFTAMAHQPVSSSKPVPGIIHAMLVHRLNRNLRIPTRAPSNDTSLHM